MPLTKEQLTERAQLVSTFEASCSLEYAEAEQLAFREGIMRKLGVLFGLKVRTPRGDDPLSKDELRERAYLVRCYKAICRVDHPEKLEARFRKSVTEKLRIAFAMGPPPGPKAPCPHN